jgi:hypothetical protein
MGFRLRWRGGRRSARSVDSAIWFGDHGDRRSPELARAGSDQLMTAQFRAMWQSSSSLTSDDGPALAAPGRTVRVRRP